MNILPESTKTEASTLVAKRRLADVSIRVKPS